MLDEDDVRLWHLVMQPSVMPELVLERPAWMADAACRGEPIQTFFPAKGKPVARAYALCSTCPVRVECRDYAVNDDELAGFWGGTSSAARAQLRRHAS